MNSSGIVLRHLTFTGKALEPASLTFGEVLNVVYGASNTGKSFVVKALNFMFGGSTPLPNIEQRRGYDQVWLGLTLPDGSDVTLYRAERGGGFILYDGLVQEKQPSGGLSLSGKHSAQSDTNVSRYLLNSLGIGQKEIVKNSYGQKDSLSFRGLTPYLFVEESTIFNEGSPILSGQVIRDTVERNIFRFLLTGRDDTAVSPSSNTKVQIAVMKGKVELVDELIAGIDEGLTGSPSQQDATAQAERLDTSLAEILAVLRERQETIDSLVNRRREVTDRQADTAARAEELTRTLCRFSKLDEVYRSDIERLSGLEEGSSLLKVRAGRPCPLCGAAPEYGEHAHDAEEIERSHVAAAVEIRKIEAERRDLRQTVISLEAETEGLQRRLAEFEIERIRIDEDLSRLRPREAQGRAEYEDLQRARAQVQRYLDLFQQREQFVGRRTQFEVRVPRRPDGETLAVGVDGATAHAFATTVQHILDAWHFPGNPVVSFDLDLQDIRIDGKERSANGKGIRAILHAAFKIGVLVFCRENGFPHPGFVVLDTPLLTYREPLKNPKHGALAEDEEALRSTTLNEYFYEYLGGLKGFGQVVILENADPPPSVVKFARVETFTAQSEVGRFGFFPPRRPPTNPPPRNAPRSSSGKAAKRKATGDKVRLTPST